MRSRWQAVFGLAWKEHEQAEAKKRQANLNGKKVLVEMFPQADQGKARDKIGERVGVSGKSIDKVATVAEGWAWLFGNGEIERKRPSQFAGGIASVPITFDRLKKVKWYTLLTTAKGRLMRVFEKCDFAEFARENSVFQRSKKVGFSFQDRCNKPLCHPSCWCLESLAVHSQQFVLLDQMRLTRFGCLETL